MRKRRAAAGQSCVPHALNSAMASTAVPPASRSLTLPCQRPPARSVDWSPDGGSVASGGKDKVLKLWRR